MRHKQEGQKNKTSYSRLNIEFEQELSKITSIDSIEPEVLILCNPQIMQTKESSSKNMEEKVTSKSKSLATTLWEIHEAKEEAKNRCLKEKLGFL